MMLGKSRRNRAKPRWLHLLVLLAALTSTSGQAFESGHLHFDAQPADCWVCHSGAAAVASNISLPAVLSVSIAPVLALPIEPEQDRKAYLPPATGPPPAF
jgi:hypothetical protein